MFAGATPAQGIVEYASSHTALIPGATAGLWALLSSFISDLNYASPICNLQHGHRQLG